MNARQVEALSLARDALVFLVQDQDRAGRFLAVTGMGPADIRARVDDPTFLAGVLDFLLGDERLVIEFTDAQDVAPEAPARARRLLPGGDIQEF